MSNRADELARFMEKVSTSDGCWEWKSTLHRDGYGKFWFCNKQAPAHRVAYELLVGPTDGNWVLHSCDNRKCVNPAHLRLGNAKENAQDRSERHRYRVRIPRPVVEEIRARYARGGITQQQLAAEYHVNQTQVSKYIRNVQRLFA